MDVGMRKGESEGWRERYTLGFEMLFTRSLFGRRRCGVVSVWEAAGRRARGLAMRLWVGFGRADLTRFFTSRQWGLSWLGFLSFVYFCLELGYLATETHGVFF